MIEYLAIPYLAAASRLHGSSGLPPKVIKAVIYAAPYTVLCWTLSEGNIAHFAAVLVLILTALSKNIGTAEGFRGVTRDNWLSAITNKIVTLAGGMRDSVAGDIVYNSCKGSLIAAPLAVFLVVFAAYYQAAAIFLSGMIGYPLAYELAYYVRQRLPERLKPSSYVVIAEVLSGAFCGLGFLVI